MLLELLEGDEHLRGCDFEGRDLLVLLLDSHVGDSTHEGEILLDAHKVVLRREAG